jgi:hypothetical protein
MGVHFKGRQTENVKIIRYLVENGADVNAQGLFIIYLISFNVRHVPRAANTAVPYLQPKPKITA